MRLEQKGIGTDWRFGAWLAYRIKLAYRPIVLSVGVSIAGALFALLQSLSKYRCGAGICMHGAWVALVGVCMGTSLALSR